MKHLFTLLIAAFSFTLVTAQITWDNATPDTVYSFETNPDVEVHNKITFADSGTYRWVREFITTCPISNAICDKNQCYLEHVDSAIFFVEKDETFPMLCHFYPADNCCKHAKTLLTVYKVSDPTIRTVAEYNIVLWCSQLSVDQISDDKNKVVVSPNPVTDNVTLLVNGFTPENVSIYDPTGRLISTVVPRQNGSIFTGDLSAGYYTLACELNGIIVRKRILKH